MRIISQRKVDGTKMNSEVLIERWSVGNELADEMIYHQIIGKCSDRAMNARNAAAGPIAVIAIFPGAILYIGFLIGGVEYHFKNIGLPSLWKLFSTTLLGQFFILILPHLIR